MCPSPQGCVLEGRMVVSEELAERIRRINEATARRSLKQDVEQQTGGDR
ncbi:hypothetical protein VU05_01125 [Desulfobulbus sp. F1]|nr:hypothetical protein [Desulfobulbus sp. F1]